MNSWKTVTKFVVKYSEFSLESAREQTEQERIAYREALRRQESNQADKEKSREVIGQYLRNFQISLTNHG
jgi:hypothetical protein